MTIRVAPWLARLILAIPVIALCVHLQTKDKWVFILYGITWLWMYWQDTTVAKIWPHSTSPSNMIMRASFWFSTLFFFPLLFTCYGGYPSWAEIIYCGFGTAIILGPFVFKLWSSFDNSQGYWVTLPWPWNPDPLVVRQGGFAEPTYTNFVPPDTWMYQCPKCGARVPEAVCVCWNCNYGADGRSDAYVQRYGNQPPPQQQYGNPPQQQYSEYSEKPQDQPLQPQPPVGPYGPIDTNTP